MGGQFEAASRPAFEMIESVVYTVGSVSQLLDSTYNAILASFRYWQLLIKIWLPQTLVRPLNV